ncbi:Na+/H+ antiporter [Rhodococcus sp. NPDC019627]|uniref:Na+/H+ antiporter n=1 Tax=unclassified Rhodococcus (in: high G+C Gram-positive bacteria) TaxID=192944 RepID=UPI0033E13CAF
MNGLEITVVLGTAVLVGSVLAPRLRMATPLFLLGVGIVLGFVPELREIELPPEFVLLLFLPVMLFWESLTTSLRAIRRDFRAVVLLSTLLVVATAFGVAGIAHAFGIPWASALVLGAAVAPPDATAVGALGRSLPHRNFMILKAESLTNDGTALVVYGIAIGIAAGDSYSSLDVTGLVLRSYVGGVLAGVGVAFVFYLLLRRLHDATSINVALLLVPFVAYLVAELGHASGVLAVVTSGLVMAYASTRISTAASRRTTESVWPLGSYVLNGALFVLIGLEAHAVTRNIPVGDGVRLLGCVVAVWLGLMVIRFVFQTLSVLIIRLLDRRPSQHERRMDYRARVVSAVAGFRGAISLALALSVPTVARDGSPFPVRDEIIIVTAGVIVLTLLVQGPLLPRVAAWARLPEDAAAPDELRTTERALLDAALTAAPELSSRLGIGDEVRDRLVAGYRRRRDQVDATTTSTPLVQDEEYSRLLLALMTPKRDVLRSMRQSGMIDDVVAHRIQTQLDVEELRLRGVEPLD